MPSTRWCVIVEQRRPCDALDAFKAEYAAELTRRIHGRCKADALVVPTNAVGLPAQPIVELVRLNSQLGIYTNFANLADLSALARCRPACARTASPVSP